MRCDAPWYLAEISTMLVHFYLYMKYEARQDRLHDRLVFEYM